MKKGITIAHPKDWQGRVQVLRARARAKDDFRREVAILERAVKLAFLAGHALGREGAKVGWFDQLHMPDIGPSIDRSESSRTYM